MQGFGINNANNMLKIEIPCDETGIDIVSVVSKHGCNSELQAMANEELPAH